MHLNLVEKWRLSAECGVTLRGLLQGLCVTKRLFLQTSLSGIKVTNQMPKSRAHCFFSALSAAC